MQYFQKCSDVLCAIEAVLLYRFHDMTALLATPPPPPSGTDTATASANSPPAPPAAASAPTPTYSLKSPHLVPFTISVESNADLKSKLVEMEADLCRRWARLDASALKIAYDVAVGNIDPIVSSNDEESKDRNGPCFNNLPVPPRVITVNYPRELTTFDAARAVFLRAAAKIESAKKYFLLDGMKRCMV